MESKKNKYNTMMKFVEKIECLSGQMYTVGTGPGRLGITQHGESDIEVGLVFEPSAVQSNTAFPENTPAYQITAAIYRKGGTEALSVAELEQMRAGADVETRRLLDVAIELCGKSYQATKEECVEAFCILAEQEINQEEQEAEGMTGPVLG